MSLGVRPHQGGQDSKERNMETLHNVNVEGARVVIPGVDKYRVPEPLFECVRVALSHRGEMYSTDYIQGKKTFLFSYLICRFCAFFDIF